MTIKSILAAATAALLCTAGPLYGKTRTETAGDIIQVALPLGAYIATEAVGDDAGTVQFFKGFAANLAATYSLKGSIHKERPDGSASNSMPSGHTSASFQAAAFIHERYGFRYAAPMYLSAAYVGYSRIYADRHHPEDVYVGALIGTLASFSFTTPYGKAVIMPGGTASSISIAVSVPTP